MQYRLGRCSTPSFNSGSVATGTAFLLIQVARNKFNKSVSRAFSPSIKEPKRSDSFRQLDGSFLHKTSRFPQIKKSVRLNQKDTGILSSTLHSVSPKTPSRSSKCLGRHKISVNPIINRVVSRPRDIQMDLRFFRPICSGPICQPNQLSCSNICVPLSRPTSYRSNHCLSSGISGNPFICILPLPCWAKW